MNRWVLNLDLNSVRELVFWRSCKFQSRATVGSALHGGEAGGGGCEVDGGPERVAGSGSVLCGGGVRVMIRAAEF